MPSEPRPRILLIDDNKGIQDLVRAWLDNRFDLEEASSAVEALRVLERFTPDLIILDVMMPGISGIEMFQMLKADPARARIPVLFLTAYHQLLAEETSLARSRVLLKPFRLEELTEQIEELLAGPSEATPENESPGAL